MQEKPVVLITGGSRGIGAATALEFSKRGYLTAIGGTDRQSLESVASDAAQNGAEPFLLVGDLSDFSFAESMVRETIAKWGRIDVLVNNAAWREVTTMRTINLESWERTIRVCLTAPAFLARWAAEHMEQRRTGVIVNVSSLMSQQASGNCPAYVACKGALDSLTYELASLYGPSGIRVVSVNPGAVDTTLSQNLSSSDGDAEAAVRDFSNDMIMLGRWASPEEIASAIAWVASDSASYLTGTTLTIDGGWQHQHFPHSLKHKLHPNDFR